MSTRPGQGPPALRVGGYEAEELSSQVTGSGDMGRRQLEEPAGWATGGGCGGRCQADRWPFPERQVPERRRRGEHHSGRGEKETAWEHVSMKRGAPQLLWPSSVGSSMHVSPNQT